LTVRNSQSLGDWSFAAFEDATPFASQLVMDAFGAPTFCTPPDRAPGELQSWFQYVAFYRWSAQHLEPVCFANFIRHPTDAGDALLCGAVCTRADVYRRVDAASRRQISEAGGLYYALSLFAHAHMAEALQMPAIFGYCGDLQAWNVNQRAGFERVDGHPYLIVKWMRPLPHADQAILIESVKARGPF
jgi:hypothetical protein